MLALVALAGCAGGTAIRVATATPGASVLPQTGTSAHAPHDFCALVTPADVLAATGLAVQPPQGTISVDANIGADADGPRTFTKLAGCRYSAVNGPAMVSLSYYYGLAPEIAGVYADRRTRAHDPRTVTGLGDAAYWDSTTLSILSGSVFAQVTVQGAPGLAPGSAPLLAAERRLAVVMLARL
jgi:hypothetical protein